MILIILLVGLLLASIIINILLYQQLQKNKIPFTLAEIDDLRSENLELKTKVEKARKFIARAKEIVAQEEALKLLILNSIPDFPRNESLETRFGKLVDFWFGYYGDKKIFIEKSPDSESLFVDIRRKLKASSLIDQLRINVTKPFATLLDRVEPEPTSQELREEFIKMAIRLYDSVHSFQNPSASPHLKLNAQYVMGEKTEEEAYECAEIFTNFEEDTPRWARRLAQCLKEFNAENQKIVFSGFKFQEENKPQNSGEIVAVDTNDTILGNEESNED